MRGNATKKDHNNVHCQLQENGRSQQEQKQHQLILPLQEGTFEQDKPLPFLTVNGQCCATKPSAPPQHFEADQ